jgi:hypothetical protein
MCAVLAHGVPEEYMLGTTRMLVFWGAEGDGDEDRDTVACVLHIFCMYWNFSANFHVIF